MWYIANKVRHSLLRALHRWYRVKALVGIRLEGGTMRWDPSTKASVPLRAEGKGLIELGANINLGYRPAPRIGTGEILLQARTANSVIRIGDGTALSNNVSVVATQSIEIGENCLIGDLVSIFDSDFHQIDPIKRWHGSGPSMSVKIGRNVWLGSRVVVLKGVSIGEDTVIAAGAVVASSLPAGVLAGGVPAKILRRIS